MRLRKVGVYREEIFSEVDDPTPSTDETGMPMVEELWVGDEEGGQGVLISRNGIAIMRDDEIVINITPDGYIIVTDDDEEELADTQRFLLITKKSISYVINPKDE